MPPNIEDYRDFLSPGFQAVFSILLETNSLGETSAKWGSPPLWSLECLWGMMRRCRDHSEFKLADQLELWSWEIPV